MADPVTLAMVGAAAGAALKPKDPLKGALLGATAGFTGGAALGAAGVGAAGAAAGTGIGAGGAAVPGIMGAGATTVPAATFGGTLSSALPSMIPNITAPALSTASMATPFTIGGAAPATFGSTLANIPSTLMNNPSMAMQGLGSAQSLMAPEQQAPMPQAGPVTRGQPRQAVDFMSLLNPQQGAQRPQPISLI